MKKNHESLFEANIELWKKSCPREATLLSYIESSSKGDRKPQQASHKNLHKKLVQSLPLDTVDLVVLYGIKDGLGYQELLPWLKRKTTNHLVFFEDEIHILRSLFETPIGKEILENPQVRILYFHDLKSDDEVFEPFYWHFTLAPFVVSCLDQEKNPERLEQLRHKIAYDMAMRNALIDEYLKYGIGFYINFYQNIMHLPQSYLGTNLFGRFAGVPAVICGAGPSLGKNSKLLATLRDKAVIFAGGSSLNALNAVGFNPHFGAGIDPNPAQLERLEASQGYGVPFFYRNRMNHAAFMKIHGPRLYIPGAGGYDTAEYFEKKLNIPEGKNPIDEGHNVVNFCTEIAHALGCNPIIFVGMDLAFTGMQQYASGVVEDPSTSHEQLTDVESDDLRPIVRNDIFGKPTSTLWKWVAESEWIGDFAKNHPLTTLINCTEGGLGFPGVPNRTLKEVAQEHMGTEYALQGRIHGEIQNSTLKQVTEKKIARAMLALRRSLGRVVEQFDVLRDEAQRSLTRLQGGEVDIHQSGRAALAETELVEEVAYTYVVDIFNEVYARLLSRESHALNIRDRSPEQKTMDHFELSLNKYKFLREVARINGEIIDHARKQVKNEKQSTTKSQMKRTVDLGLYQIKDGHIDIVDQEMKLKIHAPFSSQKLPKGPYHDGKKLHNGSCVRVVIDEKCRITEVYLEEEGKRNGQSLLYYPEGVVKAEAYYEKGLLHGPSSFWSNSGSLLAKSWYVHGVSQGKALEYYPSGRLYRVQRYVDGVLEGVQEYFDDDGYLEHALHYTKGKFSGNNQHHCVENSKL